MKVKMRQSCATSAGSFQKGDVYDVTDNLGKAWIDQGTAEAVEQPKKRAAKKTTKDEPGGESS